MSLANAFHGHVLLNVFHVKKDDVPFKSLGRIGRFSRAATKGVRFGYDGNLLGLPLIAASLATAPRGDFMPTFASQTYGLLSFPLVQGAVAGGLALIPGLGEGFILAASMFGAGFLNIGPEELVHRSVRTFSQFGRKALSLQYGSGFSDDDRSYQQRLRSTQEMGAALLGSRRFLGQEARFMHT